jgi:hypothetical protein
VRSRSIALVRSMSPRVAASPNTPSVPVTRRPRSAATRQSTTGGWLTRSERSPEHLRGAVQPQQPEARARC